jgi:CRP-like cAMP-binding protein
VKDAAAKDHRLDDATLQRIPLLVGMNDGERRQLAEIASIVRYEAGHVVIHEGRTSQNLWVLLDGSCEVVRHGGKGPAAAIRLAVLEPYTNFGEMSFFHPAPHSADVRALTPVTLWRIERAEYDELVSEGASAANRLCCNALESVAARLRRMDEWVSELIGETQKLSEKPATPARAAEWSRFREQLLSGWNL